MPAALHAIIVTFRRPQELADTVAAFRQQSRVPDSFTIVDNDADPAVQDIAARLNVRYLSRPTNEGPAGAVNAAVADIAAWADPGDFVILSDDDNPPTNPTVIEELLSAWDAARTQGLNPGGIGAAGGRYRTRTGTTERPADSELDGWICVDSLAGGIQPIYSLAALRATGSTSPDLFFGYEELELGLRLRRRGFDLLVPGHVLRESRTRLHRLGLSARAASAVRQRSPWRAYYSNRNLVWIARRHGSVFAPVAVSGRALAGALRAVVIDGDGHTARLAARGVLDGWRGRLGRQVDPAAPVVPLSARHARPDHTYAIDRYVMAEHTPNARALAYYLPQFHPVAENDAWWGPGFTEWTNVAKARPLFPGHYQPHVPGELGFYDLRVAETRQAQADLAAAYGVEGFCYYHYWFGDGRRLLERPFQEVLDSGEPDFPFCLAWANQTWTGIWHGAPNRVLVEQRYPGDDDYIAHFQAVLPALRDRRAVTVGGRPLFMVYRPQDLPEARRFVDVWRTCAAEAGLPGLYLVGRSTGEWNPLDHGFDATVASQVVPPFTSRRDADPRASRRPDWWLSALTRRIPLTPAVYSFPRWSHHVPSITGPDSFPTVVPGWDNTPRSGRRGLVFVGSTPALFERQVRRAVELVADRDPDKRIVFVQAWNEWAEGNHLEPDRRHGRAYLEALRRGLGDKRPERRRREG